MKRIVGYVPNGDGSKDRGETMTVYEFYNDKIEEVETNAFGIKKSTKKSVDIADIYYIDCYKGSELRNESASGAVAGGLLFGLPGAIIGGLLGANQNSWYCKIQTTSSIWFFRLNSDLDQTFIKKWSDKVKVHFRGTESLAAQLGFENGEKLIDAEERARAEAGDPLEKRVDVDILEINQRLAKLGALATSEFYRHKKHVDYFTELDILRLEAMERSEQYQK